jgi:hypothetical protein
MSQKFSSPLSDKVGEVLTSQDLITNRKLLKFKNKMRMRTIMEKNRLRSQKSSK